jgi:acetyl-CoA carboxylase carboxyltransferase component
MSHRRDDLAHRQDRARAQGGAERIARQHARGRLTARERIRTLLDADSFDERGLLAHSDRPEAQDKTPADGKITGFGQIDGRTVFVSADDATVMAGAGGRVGVEKQYKGTEYATRKGFPVIHLGDGGGARIPDIMGATGMMSMVYPINGQPRNRYVPQIVAILGECYGGPTWTASVSDVVVQTKDAIMAVAGPPILETATGEQATPDQLGGWELHAHTTGLTDLFAEDDAHALRLVRETLTYFPQNADQLPPRQPTSEAPHRRLDAITHIVPDDPKAVYDMHDVLDLLADANSVLAFKPHFDGSLITALARLDGYPVGILANNPLVTVGAMGPGACEKAVAFIALCDSFHIPLVFLHDTPGFFVSQAAEERKMPLKIMTFIQALQQSTVPRVGVIVRKSYGMAHCNMVGANMGAESLFAWPIAEVSFMAPEVAVNVVYGRKLATLDDPDTARESFIAQMRSMNEPWAAAGLNLVDKIIDPVDTRREIIRALGYARGADGTQGKSRRLLANWPRML